MDKELLEAITKSLPSMQMEALKKELDRVSKFDQISKDYQEKCSTISKLNIDISDLRNLVKREEDLKAREYKLEIELLKKDLECEKSKNSSMSSFMGQVFRNPVIMEHSNLAITGSQNCNGYTTPVTNTKEIT